MFLNYEAINNIGDLMNKMLPILFISLIAALSGCIGSNSTPEATPAQMFEHADLNLNGRIADMKLTPDDARAGEEVTTELVIANTGTEVITKETAEIKAKVDSLEDFWANLALKTMSDEEKTRTFTIDFNEMINPGAIKSIGAVFHTEKEMQGKSLAGTYTVTIVLSINGQKVDSKAIPITLHSGTPRKFTPAPHPTQAATDTPTPAPAPTPAVIETPAVTPTPAPTPAPVVVYTPTGVQKEIRVVPADKFGTNNVQINAGDEITWLNREDDVYTLIERDNKINNITLYSRANCTFTVPGDYHFVLTRPGLRSAPSVLNIAVNASASN